jgi:hypothetical protein
MISLLTNQYLRTIFPPTEARKASLYSSIHPHYQQSQLNLLDPEMSQLFKRARGMKVILSPKDVLFVSRIFCSQARTNTC